jgi:O-antigen/teichoic acid export membrane protein
MKTGDFERISINAARYIVILMLYMAIIITFLSEHIIEFLFGSKFTESAGVLKILIWATVPYSMVTVFAYSLFSSFNQRVDLAINGIGLASNVLLNILLIPRFSYLGTSFAVVVSACILLICQWIFINRNLFPLKMTRILLRPLLGAAIMVSFIVLLRSKVNIYLLLFGATFPYGCSLYLLGAFDGSEMAYLRQVTSRLFHFRKVPLLR